MLEAYYKNRLYGMVNPKNADNVLLEKSSYMSITAIPLMSKMGTEVGKSDVKLHEKNYTRLISCEKIKSTFRIHVCGYDVIVFVP